MPLWTADIWLMQQMQICCQLAQRRSLSFQAGLLGYDGEAGGHALKNMASPVLLHALLAGCWCPPGNQAHLMSVIDAAC